jgi:hypothetical protein
VNLFGTPPGKDEAGDLRLQLNDQADVLYDYKQRLAEAERRMALMVMARDPAKMDELALKFATEVEDMFARGWDGGVTQRRAVIQVAARVLIETAMAGGKPEFV